ncbi:MAG: fluoride efflux transporter CrcB [Eubacteriales bacterium]|nr:fluoride efflux transporter CrcB [Eubacteriales bacterium]
MIQCLFVGIGGFIGCVCRYLIGLLPYKMENGFPIKTLIINVVGAFLISLFATFVTKGKITNTNIELMLKVGICGGFTTFSTFAFESTGLMNQGNYFTAITYIIISVVLGVMAVLAGQYIV